VVCDPLIVGQPVTTPVDVALYDTYGRAGTATAALRTLVADPNVAHVALFTMELHPDLVAEGRLAGAAGFISKALPAEEIATALERIARGDAVVAGSSLDDTAIAPLEWPGRVDGLTERESQVLVLVAEGLSNREVAAALYLAPETVKSHLSRVFTKLNIHNRVEATNYVRHTESFRRKTPPVQ
jgi:DNA-binding NarL/FixJ family response regulator